jgi:hypothetical protein
MLEEYCEMLMDWIYISNTHTNVKENFNCVAKGEHPIAKTLKISSLVRNFSTIPSIFCVV